VDCVIHIHSPSGMAVSALKCGLLPLTQNAMFFGKLGYHDYESMAIDEQKRLVCQMRAPFHERSLIASFTGGWVLASPSSALTLKVLQPSAARTMMRDGSRQFADTAVVLESDCPRRPVFASWMSLEGDISYAQLLSSCYAPRP
jgi:hypothetical protein